MAWHGMACLCGLLLGFLGAPFSCLLFEETIHQNTKRSNLSTSTVAERGTNDKVFASQLLGTATVRVPV